MVEPGRDDRAIEEHYTRQGLGNAILEGLAGAGKDLHNLQPADLAPVDEFHIRGRAATLELARAVNLAPGMHVLDAGSGVGGPSRTIAAEFGCRVTGIDITEEYCRVAEMLAEKVGLSRLVTYLRGDACRIPFPDGTFDVAWSQHTAMNISEKERFYGELYRTLKPGGTLALYDILAGPGGDVHFPVPWARTPEGSFLSTPDELRCLLEAAGFTVTSWLDSSAAALSWFRSVSAPGKNAAARPLGLHLLMGEQFPAMTRNQLRNLEEERILLYQITASKEPSPGVPAYQEAHLS